MAISKATSAEYGLARCFWCAASPAYRHYHDSEWGLPVVDDRRLFEKSSRRLPGGPELADDPEQARRSAFAGFDAAQGCRFGTADVTACSATPGSCAIAARSTINNARRVLELREEFGSLAAYAWLFEPTPRSRPKRMTLAALKKSAASAESMAMSKDLKKRGWSFAMRHVSPWARRRWHLQGCHVRDSCCRPTADRRA